MSLLGLVMGGGWNGGIARCCAPFEAEFFAGLRQRRGVTMRAYPGQMLFDHAGELFTSGLLIAGHQPQSGGDDHFIGGVLKTGFNG